MCAKPHVSTPVLHLQHEQKQQQNLTQRLIMSAHMQQAIRLLQLPLLELEPFIEEQVALNPLLEVIDENEIPAELSQESLEEIPENVEAEVTISDQDLSILTRLEEDWREHFSGSDTMPIKRSVDEEKLKSFLDSSVHMELNLHAQLIQEAHDTFETPEDFQIAETLIGYIDECGFLKTSLSEICALHTLHLADVQRVLKEIQTFEPYGVGAANIQESLLIQLRCLHKENTLAYRLVAEHYEALLHNQIPLIQKSLKCSYAAIQRTIENDIAKLDLHPGMQFSLRPTQPIIPDVTLRQEEDRLIVEVEKDLIPSLRLNKNYLNLLTQQTASAEVKHFIKHHLFLARWLMRNLQQRHSTLERIAEALAEKQYKFFMNPNGQLVPLTMKVLADKLQVHESTIARTVSNKYINSPRGIFPLRTFFTNKYVSEKGEDLSGSTVKQAILEFIQQEDKNHPLSDEKISFLMRQKGITCARRTVAKYRLMLKIGNTQQRRKFG